jgi:plasmid stabilization system protein ParE
MSPPNINLHPEAARDVEEGFAWYVSRSQQAAHRFVHELTEALDKISVHPLRWPAYLYGARRLSLKRFPYFVVYEVNDDEIRVLAVAHGRQRPGYWRHRR